MTPVRHHLHEKLLLCFCNLGETLPLSSGNKITLKFTANGTETAKGFHFVYQGKTSFFPLLFSPDCSLLGAGNDELEQPSLAQ